MGDLGQSAVEPGESANSAAGPGPVDGAEIEMATGLSLEDIAALKTDGSEEVRAEIAAKFAAQYDRLNRGRSRKLTDDILHLFSRDASKKVRARFAEEIKASRHLTSIVAAKLARDDLEIATPILETSPVLHDADLASIIQELPEPYALAIANREPLSETITELLLEYKGTTKIVSRLIDNKEAALSEAAMNWIFEWSETNPEISKRLEQRPDLPFEIVQRHVAALGEKLNWNAIATQSMTKDEAAQLQGQIHGSTRNQLGRDSKRVNQMLNDLRNQHDKGNLTPFDIIGYLRDQNIYLVEFSLAIITKLKLRHVRNLLYGIDKRGLVALCLRADFTTPEYLAFRMALGLVEISALVDRVTITYEPITVEFARAQFEEMRSQPLQVSVWLEGHHGY